MKRTLDMKKKLIDIQLKEEYTNPKIQLKTLLI